VAQKLQDLVSECENHPSLPPQTVELLQNTAAVHDIVLRINAFLDFQSVALTVVDDTDQLCVAASFGAVPKIRRGVQTSSLIEIATQNDWIFLPQGAVVASFKTSADELIKYNWHPDDVLCIPLAETDVPLTALLTVARPRENRVYAKNIQALYGVVRWLTAEFEKTFLEMKLAQTEAMHKRAEAALAAQKRRETAPPPDAIPEIPKNTGNQQLQEELLQRNRELLSLQAAVAATTSSLDMPFVLETVTWEVANLLNVEGCTVSEINQADGTAAVVAKYGLENWWEQGSEMEADALYPLKRQILSEKYAAQITVSQPDIQRADREYMQQKGMKTLLVLPMVFQDEVVGMIEIFDTRQERTFTDREISLTQLLVNQAATAIAHARLYRQMQKELTERKKTQAQIAASLREKEILLKEIHHRVKNNLQVVSSLLFLQTRFVEDETVLKVLQESRSRVRTMAMIHEKLYRSDDFARIDFLEYLRTLTAELVSTYNRSEQSVAVRTEGDEVLLTINVAVPCGLIVNELVANALQHAFPPDREITAGDKISISLKRREDTVELMVCDNGTGLPPDVDLENTGSLGMQLVLMLTRQLRGEMTVEREHGTKFILTFPV